MSKKQVRFGLRALMVAVLLAAFFVLPALAADTWKQENGEWCCFDSYGNKYKGTWCRNGQFYYYTDPSTGAIVKNQLIDDGQYKYYCGSDGIRVTDKLMKVELADRPDGYEWMYFQPTSGRAAVGETSINSQYYIFDDNGYMLYGLLTEDLEPTDNPSESYWYQGSRDKGTGYTGWLHYVDEEDVNYPGETSLWFYYYKGKKYKSTSVSKNGYKYELDANGAMLHGWVKDEGTETWRYYGDADDGVLKRSCWFQSDFDFTTGESGGETYWYYVDGQGLRKGTSATEFVCKIDGKFYLFNNGHMVNGLVVGRTVGDDFTDQANFLPLMGETETYTTSPVKFSTLPLTWEDGSRVAVMYFSASEEDAAMKTGSQQVDIGGEQVTMEFDKHGYALEGLNKNKIYQNGILQSAEGAKVAVRQLRLGSDELDAGWYLVNNSGTVLFATVSKDENEIYWAATKNPAESESGSYCIYRLPDKDGALGAANLLKSSNDTAEEWIASDRAEYDKMYYKQLQSGSRYYNIYRSFDSEKHYYSTDVVEAAKR